MATTFSPHGATQRAVESSNVRLWPLEEARLKTSTHTERNKQGSIRVSHVAHHCPRP